MSKLTSIGQASKNALAKYIQDAINNPKWGDKPADQLLVEPRWPDWRKPKPRMLTIVDAGKRTYGSDPVLGWWHASKLVEPQPPGLPPGMYMYRWVVGWYEQPVQMDIWCLYDADRDDLIARLDQILHAGPGELASTQPGGLDPVVDYIVLDLLQQDGWLGGYCGAYFSEDGPELIETAVNAEQTIYRAKWDGTLEMALTVDAPAFNMAKAIFKQRLSETALVTTGNYDLQLTVQSTSVTWAKNTT